MRQISRILEDNARFWRIAPFAQRDYPWREENPGLVAFLEALEDDQVGWPGAQREALAQDLLSLLEAAADVRGLIERADAAVPELEGTGVDLAGEHFVGVRGRKAAQIRAFCGQVPRLGLSYLDWCAGKGHLARVLVASHGGVAECLEVDGELCRAGQRLAGEAKIGFRQIDVLGPLPKELLSGEGHAVALHACGDLHGRLIEGAMQGGLRALTISPCCYHRTAQERYKPFSQAGRACQLELTRADLRMVAQETVVAGRGVRRKRREEVRCRLGFDSLQRELRGEDLYMNVPNLPKAVLRGGFEGFCRWAAEKKGLKLPGNVNFSHWEKVGEQRFRMVDRLELVRGLFRRPLEVWLALDRGAALEEAGYRVKMGAFCDRRVTPRNLMVHAER